MRPRKKPSQKPAVGMADQHIRRLDPATVQQPFEISDLIARVVYPSYRVARANPGPIVRAGTNFPTELRQHIRPEIGAAVEADQRRHRRQVLALFALRLTAIAAGGYPGQECRSGQSRSPRMSDELSR